MQTRVGKIQMPLLGNLRLALTDGTGLIHYRARNYLPGLGIFTSRDPAGMVDAVSPYAYVGNMPTMAGDPNGEVANFVFGAVANVGVGALIRGGIAYAQTGSLGSAASAAFNRNDILIDAGIGAATSGVAAIAQARSVFRAADSFRDAGVIVGNAQRTGQASNSIVTQASGIIHEYRATSEAVQMARTGAYDTVYLNRAYSTATGVRTTPTRLPDVVGVANGGRSVTAVEVASRTDDVASLLNRNRQALTQLENSGVTGTVDVIKTTQIPLLGSIASAPKVGIGYDITGLGLVNGMQLGSGVYDGSGASSPRPGK
jgi:RHS repeat-associated protein